MVVNELLYYYYTQGLLYRYVLLLLWWIFPMIHNNMLIYHYRGIRITHYFYKKKIHQNKGRRPNWLWSLSIKYTKRDNPIKQVSQSHLEPPPFLLFSVKTYIHKVKELDFYTKPLP